MPKLEQRAVLFAYVVGIDHLYESLGDRKADTLIAECIAACAGAVACNGGTVVKTVGEAVMGSFPSVHAAAIAAIEMREGVRSLRKSKGTPLAIGVGFHFGGVTVQDDGDLFGDTVSIASQLSTRAIHDQILISGQIIEQLPPKLRLMANQVDRIEGERFQLDIYELDGPAKAT